MEQRKKIPKQERVTIHETVREKLEKLTLQANEALQGVATVAKSDVVTLVVQSHPDTLSRAQVENLKATHFDEIKFASWLRMRLSDARTHGQELSLLELVERSRGVLEQKSRGQNDAHALRARPRRMTRVKSFWARLKTIKKAIRWLTQIPKRPIEQDQTQPFPSFQIVEAKPLKSKRKKWNANPKRAFVTEPDSQFNGALVEIADLIYDFIRSRQLRKIDPSVAPELFQQEGKDSDGI